MADRFAQSCPDALLEVNRMRHLRLCPPAQSMGKDTDILLEADQKRQLEEIIGEITCPKGFKCYKSGLRALCRARDIGLDTLLECLEEDPESCKFSFAFYGYSYFCQCPVRVYVSKRLEKKRPR
ncbi:MAG: hypothetical protein SWE60_09680 [Thermodesulfobacteriota bacterium]|nr:hypothetical protein [Thermodesulfobacteriota bacterium]